MCATYLGSKTTALETNNSDLKLIRLDSPKSLVKETPLLVNQSD